MTALAATPQAGSALAPPSVLLQVTGSPLAPTTAYTSNFTASADSWTASGTGANATLWTSPNTWLWLQGAASGTVGNVITASRVVTGLVVGAVYKLRVTATRNDPNAGTTRLRITGGTTGAYLTVPVGSNAVLELTFTATATSHTVNVDQQRTFAGTPEGLFILAASVQPSGTWQGTTIRRTDANGTNVVVRENVGGLDINGTGALTFTDYEAALTGPLTYTVTDGTGGTATAVATMAESRRNLCTNPQPTTATGWTGTGGAIVPAPWNASRSAYQITGTGAATAFAFSEDAGTIPSGTVVTVSATIQVPAGKWYVARVHVRTGNKYYGALTYQLSPGGPIRVSATATLTAADPDVEFALLVADDAAGSALTSGVSAYVGDVLIERAPAATAYFDGSTPDVGAVVRYWLGTPDASVSVETNPDVAPGPSLSLPATSVPTTTPPQFVALSMVTGYQEESASNGSLHTIVGRADKIANPGPLSLRSGTVTLWAPDWASALAVRQLLDSGEVAQVRQPTFPGMDLYLYATSVRIAPEDPVGTTRRWAVDLAYEEVLAP